jgi:hypothetical protein
VTVPASGAFVSARARQDNEYVNVSAAAVRLGEGLCSSIHRGVGRAARRPRRRRRARLSTIISVAEWTNNCEWAATLSRQPRTGSSRRSSRRWRRGGARAGWRTTRRSSTTSKPSFSITRALATPRVTGRSRNSASPASSDRAHHRVVHDAGDGDE